MSYITRWWSLIWECTEATAAATGDWWSTYVKWMHGVLLLLLCIVVADPHHNTLYTMVYPVLLYIGGGGITISFKEVCRAAPPHYIILCPLLQKMRWHPQLFQGTGLGISISLSIYCTCSRCAALALVPLESALAHLTAPLTVLHLMCCIALAACALAACALAS